MKVAEFFHFPVGPGFDTYVFPTKRFKSSHLGVFLHRALDGHATQLSLLESVLQRGCRGYPSLRAISSFLESLYGASFDTDVQKIGERQILSLSMRVLNDRFAPKRAHTLEQSLDFLYRMLADPLREKARLRKDFIDQEKRNLERYLKGLINDRMGYALMRCTQLMCPTEPFGISEYGTLEDIPAIDPETLTDFHDVLLSNSPLDIFVAGDHDPEKVAARIARTFRRLKSRDGIDRPPGIVAGPVRVMQERRETMEVEQAKVVMGFRTGRTLADPLFPALAFFNGILGAYPHSRLFADLREKQGLCYQAHSFVEATKGILIVVMGIDAKNYSRARDSVVSYIDDLKSGRFSEEEFQKTRELIFHAVRGRDDSPGTMIHGCLEGLINGRVLTTQQSLERIRSVKSEDIPQAASRLSLDTVFLLCSP